MPLTQTPKMATIHCGIETGCPCADCVDAREEQEAEKLYIHGAEALSIDHTTWCYGEHPSLEGLYLPHDLNLSGVQFVDGDNAACDCCRAILPLTFDAANCHTWADVWQVIDRWRKQGFKEDEEMCFHRFIEDITIEGPFLMVHFGS